MNRDGTDPVQLTGPFDRCNTRPRWSQDGSIIAFTTSREVERSWEVYVMDADAGNQRNVSDNGGEEEMIPDLLHDWSPDGRVVFQHGSGADARTFIVNPDGTGRDLLFPQPGDFAPFWSPDGSNLLFARHGENGTDVYLADDDGSEARRLTDPTGEPWFWPGRAGQPWADPWSPDGTRIVFTSSLAGEQEIYVMNADGTGLVNLTNHPGGNQFDGWSPDGTRIAFSSDREGTWNIYLVNPVGTGFQRLTDTASNDRNAVWVPAS